MHSNQLPKFHGVAPALVTPMLADRSIDWKGLKNLIQHHPEIQDSNSMHFSPL